MSELDAPPSPEPALTLSIPANLAPVDAAQAREDILAQLSTAGPGLQIDLDGSPVSPCGLQILVAVSRSARQRGLSWELTGSATDAIRDAGLAEL